ncbi:MAG: hypothetical protein KGL78_15480 [Burkholderiales bacterium]|nr:hypothetical protein [Burkholderiales bacterium]
MSTDPYFERPAIFETGGSERIGIITRPLAEPRNVGVVVIVGGPQYRVGSHRQFALLARHLGAEHEHRSFKRLPARLRTVRWTDSPQPEVLGRGASIARCDDSIDSASCLRR